MKFKDSNLNPIIKKNLNHINYDEMTPIQSKTIPVALNNSNIIGLAATGTGKTAAFLLPIIQKIMDDKQKNKNNKNPLALVLAPTRDLVYQIFENFIQYAKNTHIHAVCVYGGVGYNKQIQQIKKGVDIVFANTGRLMDLVINKNILKLYNVKYFVLDEADQMLDMGFSPDILKINELLKNKQQIFLFSATMPETIKKLINKIFGENNYVYVDVNNNQQSKSLIKQEVYLINPQKRNSIVVDLIQKKLTNNKQAIIFCRTKTETKNVYQLLKDLKYKVDCLHSDRSQPSRVKALRDFKNFEIEILVTTNIAARGIDINNLELVFNYNLPDDNETFVHRIGRTGRKGNSGTAITLITKKELYRLSKIEELTKTKIKVIKCDNYLNNQVDHKIDDYRGYKNIKGNKKHKFNKQKNKYQKWEFKPRGNK